MRLEQMTWPKAHVLLGFLAARMMGGGRPESLGIEQAVKVHVTIHMDQKAHHLCLGLYALYLSWGR